MRRQRGPLSGATSAQITALRALAQAYHSWVQAAGTPSQTKTANVPAIGRHLSLPAYVETEFAVRAARRISRRPDAAAIAERHAQLSEQGPTTAPLSIVLVGIHEELTRIRRLLEDRTAHSGHAELHHDTDPQTEAHRDGQTAGNDSTALGNLPT